ncbi:glycosyltransferase family 4 protein [bacterium]|nr:glycosyltransferase family 4 protein [bacterium]
MKIALVANSKQWIMNKYKGLGGGNIVSSNIFRILKAQGHEIVIICYGEKEDEREGNLTVRYIDDMIGCREFTASALKIASECDITINFMTQNIFSGVILQSHSYLYRTERSKKFFIPIKRFLYSGKINAQKKLFSSSKIDYAFAVSEGIKEDYEKNLGVKNIKVSYLGCNQIYSEFNGDKNDVLTFGFISNSSSNKSGYFCVLGLIFAKLSGLKFRLKMISPKYNKDFLMKILLNLSGLRANTEILPAQDDMTEFYKSIDCVLMPSIHEAFGLVPLEALSFCKTCLVSENIGFSELIDETAGFKFNRLSFMSFVSELLKAGKMFYSEPDKFREIRYNGWKISQKYTWERFVEGLIS